MHVVSKGHLLCPVTSHCNRTLEPAADRMGWGEEGAGRAV